MRAGGLGTENLVGALADDMIAREAREALERAVGEDIAAVLDVLGGDADRNVVEHRFQELRGRGQLARQLALFGAILMGCDRPAVRQAEIFHQDRFAVGQFGDQAVRAGGLGVEFVDADIQHAALAPHLQDFGPGHVAGNIRAHQAVDFEIAVVAEDDALLRIGHHHALVEIVQGGGDEGTAPQLRALDPAQRRQHPQPDRGQEGYDHDAADQQLPDHVGIECAEIARRRKAAGRGRRGACQSARRSGGEQTHEGQRRNRIPPACLPVLASHHSPADFSGGVSGFTGLDRVNAYPATGKCDSIYGNCPDMINASLTGPASEQMSRQSNGLATGCSAQF